MQWLAASNFDAHGQQLERLADLIARQRASAAKSGS